MKSGFHGMTMPRPNAVRRRPGFTLLELLTVMGIMAFIMSITVASFYQMRRGIELRSAVTTMRGKIARARENAIFKRTLTRIRIVNKTAYAMEERSGGAYIAIGDSESVLPPGVTIEFPSGPPPNAPAGYLGTNSPNNVILFDPDGRTDSLIPYRIRLGEAYRSNNKADIVVNGLTGLASVEYTP